MTHEGLHLVKDGAIARITFDRPDRANAISPSWMQPILGFLREAEYDPEIRCVLISARGKHFQAGGDLSFDEQQSLPDIVGFVQDTMLEWNRVMIAIESLPKPVVAAVQGGTIGASTALVAACDLVVAAEDAFFIVAQSKIGASLDGLPSYLLPRKVGLAKAMEWTLLGDRISVAEAHGAGLVNRVVPRDQLESAAEDLCARLARGPTRAMGLSKRLLNTAATRDIHGQSMAEAEAYAVVVQTQDWNEGRQAFLQKRDPRFSGR